MSRFLSSPQPLRVFTDHDGKPVAFIWRHDREPVTICNHWRLENDWWRKGICREYYRLLAKSGSVCTVYHDLKDGRWYLQRTLD